MTTLDLGKVFVTLTLIVLLGETSAQVVFGRNGLSAPTFIISGPTRARYDTVTTFSVSASNVVQPATISLLLRTGNAMEIRLNRTQLTFQTDGVQTWDVVIDTSRMVEHQQNLVQLRATHNRVSKVLDVTMNSLSGFIMIQTDKVIYNPGQTVMYRVIGLDDDQKFAPWPITVDIKNPDLIIMDRQPHESRQAFSGRNFTLPRDASPGTWSVTAAFRGGKVVTTKTINFEVEEYVLPTFKVTVSAVEKVISLSTNWLQVRTKAVYSYGRPVQGTAVMRLGVVGVNKVFLFETAYNSTLNADGEWNFSVPVRDMRNHRSWFPDGSPLYIGVNVTEAGTGEINTAVAVDTFFANPYYIINLDGSKKHFKPGFNYSLAMEVRAANGDPASNVNVYVLVSIKDGNNASMIESFSSIFQLDQHGRRVESIEVPAQAASLNFRIYTVDPLNPDWAFKEMYVKKFASATNNYLQLYYNPDNSLTISYTAPSDFHYGPGQLVTVLIISKNRLVHSFTVPRSRAGSVRHPLSHEVLVAAAPKARAVAYYYVSEMNSEIVSDSLLFDTPDQCREEMNLGHSSQRGLGAGLELVPKQRTSLEVLGGAGMSVGLLAVDKAVYFLRDERSLTRNKIFSTLGDADEGHGVGDGDTVDKIFEKAGLQFKKLSMTLGGSSPVADSTLDLSGLNIFFPDVRQNELQHWSDINADDEQIPLEMVRRHFPESWLFREITLPESGFTQEPITLPDSITTWTFTAVGVGREGGVCMTNPLELVTFKPFFAQVRLPYKAVRLEAVHVNIGIYNYQPFPINVTVTVRGDIGLCFADSMHDQQYFAYAALLRPNQANSESIRVIPLVAGDVKLTVDVRSTNGQERDIVEKTLYVVPEGRRVQKSITFPLDPSGQHSSHQRALQGVQSTHTATITNRINSEVRQQLTNIMLYMPEEVIQGSERCQISACGDLMGDIISTSVMDGDNLFESSIADAEEVIGNLAPSVYALLYANRSHFMTPEMETKGQQHVKHGVIRLETYRNQDGSFSLTPDSPPATWLTALVLKTLCHVEQITFVDNEAFVMRGFAWLLDQVTEEGHLLEQDYRLARPSEEYNVMLSAETLISLHECALSQSRTLLDDDMQLMAHQEDALFTFLDEMGDRISPLLLAKVAYALTLSDPTDPYAIMATERLSNMTRTTVHGLQYWAVVAEEDSDDDLLHRPFWYHSGSKASSIEATAYALLVFSKHQQQARSSFRARSRSSHFSPQSQPQPRSWPISLDAVAGWLIQKRNSRGAFIGAMDTAVATQALSEYSLNKLGVAEVDLHCNVTTNPVHNYTHSFNFNEQNAITPKSLSNVPMGRQLLVETRGTGLGQMQVRVQYNVPVEANAHCRYNVTVTRRAVSYIPYSLEGDEVCQYCNMGCNDDGDDENNNDDIEGDVGVRASGSPQGSPGPRWRERSGPRPSSRRQKRAQHRERRQISGSRPTICIQVCLRSTDRAFADRTILDISMLTGFQPLARDLQRIYDKRDRLSLASLTYVAESTSVQMKFSQIPHNRDTCVSFRAIEQHDVDRRNPALVTVRSHQDPEPTCVTTYDPVVSEVNLEVYCASNQSNNQGQCRCFSGLCGLCYPRTADVSYSIIRSLVCSSQYIYKVRRPQTELSDDWVDMRMDVLEIAKNGSEPVDPVIHLVTPRTCNCPHRADMSPELYFFGSHVDTFVDRNNSIRKTYLVDHSTTFVSAHSVQNRHNPNRIADFIRMAMNTCGN